LFVQRRRLLLFLHGCCSRGRKMLRGWGRMAMALAVLVAVVRENGSGS
jgi:hypothetical protein